MEPGNEFDFQIKHFQNLLFNGFIDLCNLFWTGVHRHNVMDIGVFSTFA